MMKKSTKIMIGISIILVVLIGGTAFLISSLPSKTETAPKATKYIKNEDETQAMRINAPKDVLDYGNKFVTDFFSFQTEKFTDNSLVTDKITPYFTKYGAGTSIEYQLTSSSKNETSYRLNYSVSGLYHEKKEEFAMIVNLSKTDNQLAISNFSVVDLNE